MCHYIYAPGRCRARTLPTACQSHSWLSSPPTRRMQNREIRIPRNVERLSTEFSCFYLVGSVCQWTGVPHSNDVTHHLWNKQTTRNGKRMLSNKDLRLHQLSLHSKQNSAMWSLLWRNTGKFCTSTYTSPHHTTPHHTIHTGKFCASPLTSSCTVMFFMSSFFSCLCSSVTSSSSSSSDP